MSTKFFTSERYTPPALLRRTGEATDEAFHHGAWQPTPYIVDWFFGNADDVTEITEAQARAFAPDAFTSPS